MAGLIFVSFVGLIFLCFPCTGQISPPLEGSIFYAFPGENVTITWRLVTKLTDLTVRGWTFRTNSKFFAQIFQDEDVKKFPEHSPGLFTIKKPSTLILENVNGTYNGTYKFAISVGLDQYSSVVSVFVVGNFTVTINCTSAFDQSNVLTVDEGDNFTCLCEAKGGNPPAEVMWEKDGVPEPGGAGMEQKILTRNNVSETDKGIYKCVGRSHTLTNNKSIEVKVRPYAKPMNTTIKIMPKQATVGKDVEITCSSKGVPDPHFTIMLPNGTNITTAEIPYTLENVQKSDEGKYTCIAINKRGEDSATGYLNVTVSSGGDGDDDSGSGSTNIGAIVGGVCGGLALLAIVAGLVYYFKTKEKDGRNCGNIDPAASNHYELENEDAGPGDNAYDSVGPVGTSSGKSKPPEKNTLPPVYAAVDKNNRQGNTLYASLDTDAMKPKRESKKEPERTPQTEYASIDFAKRADDNVPKADLV